MATTRLMTVDDLLALPDDAGRFEVIAGEPCEMPPSGFEASVIARRIGGRLGEFADDTGLGAVTTADGGYVFARDPLTVRAPDVAFVRAERLPPAAAWPGYLEIAPDLAVEVVSPSDQQQRVNAKVAFYLAHDVRLVWVAYPRRRQLVTHRPGQEPVTSGLGEVLQADDLLPGFRLPVAEIFGTGAAGRP